MLVVLAFGMLIGFGGTALISIRLGEGKKAEAEQVLGNTAVLLVVASVFITTVGLLWLDDILVVFGASDTVLPYARDYLRIIVLGTVFQTVAFGLNAAIRGEGNPKIAMLSMLISVLLNAILAPIFIFGFSWGMQGAALATVISQAVTAVWVVGYFLGGASVLRFHAHTLRLNGNVCRQILMFGSPPFAMQLAASVLQSILNHQLGIYGGDLAISVMGVLYAMFMMVADADLRHQSGGPADHRLQLRSGTIRPGEESPGAGDFGGDGHCGRGVRRDDAVSGPSDPAVQPPRSIPAGSGNPCDTDFDDDVAVGRFPDRQCKLLSGDWQAEGGPCC